MKQKIIDVYVEILLMNNENVEAISPIHREDSNKNFFSFLSNTIKVFRVHVWYGRFFLWPSPHPDTNPHLYSSIAGTGKLIASLRWAIGSSSPTPITKGVSNYLTLDIGCVLNTRCVGVSLRKVIHFILLFVIIHRFVLYF